MLIFVLFKNFIITKFSGKRPFLDSQERWFQPVGWGRPGEGVRGDRGGDHLEELRWCSVVLLGGGTDWGDPCHRREKGKPPGERFLPAHGASSALPWPCPQRLGASAISPGIRIALRIGLVGWYS